MTHPRRLRVLLVANVLTHYRLPLYEQLQELVDLHVVFYSDGGEWYWRRTETPSDRSLFHSTHLKGVWLGRTRYTPGLVREVLRSDADVIIKDPNGKFALPVTFLLAKLRRRPFVLWASLWQHPTRGLHRFTRPVMRYVYRHSDWVVTYGRHVSRFVIAEGARPARVSESVQAVAPAFSEAPTADRWARPTRLLFVGRLEPWKGIDVLIDALALLERGLFVLDIAGDGSQRDELEKRVAKLGLGDAVTFLGHVPNRELLTTYQRAAALIVPSVHTPDFCEPWSLVVNEGMQAGALVVATEVVGAVADGLVADGVTGLVCRGGGPESLAQVIGDMLSTEPAKLATMAAAGQRAVRAYSHQRAAAAFAEAALNAFRERNGFA